MADALLEAAKDPRTGLLTTGAFQDRLAEYAAELSRDVIARRGLGEIARWVLRQHERFDGSGYPEGLDPQLAAVLVDLVRERALLTARTSARSRRA